MVRIEKDSSELEPEVRPLTDAAHTQQWKSALNILFLNGSVLQFSEEMGIPCLVTSTGPVERIDRIMDLLLGKATTNLYPLIVPLARHFIPKVLLVLKRTEITEVDEERRVAIFVAGILPELEKSRRLLMKAVVDGAFTISEMIAVGIFKSLNDFRNSQIHAALDEGDYEEMVEALQRLEVIQPRLQVSICPKCANFTVTISNCPSITESCPKCGEGWVSEMLYTLKPSFDNLKMKNIDLPLFISSYLRYIVSVKAPLADFQIYPSASVTTDQDSTSAKRVELDVYLPQFNGCIECKVYEDAFAPMTMNRMSSITGRLIQKIESYLALGLENVYFVTNLPDSSADKVQTALQNAIANKEGSIEFGISGVNVDSLLKWLNEISSSISDRFNSDLELRFKEAMSEESLSKNSQNLKLSQ